MDFTQITESVFDARRADGASVKIFKHRGRWYRLADVTRLDEGRGVPSWRTRLEAAEASLP